LIGNDDHPNKPANGERMIRQKKAAAGMVRAFRSCAPAAFIDFWLRGVNSDPR
jgi:hypothetical protein